MNNRTDLVGISIGERVKQQLRTYRVVLECLGNAAASLLMAGSSVFGGISPFGVAMAASVKRQFLWPAVLGSVLGYLLFQGDQGNMLYIAATLMVLALRWTLSSTRLFRIPVASSPVTAALAMAVASAAVLLSGSSSGYDWVLAGAQVLLAGGASYFFTRTIRAVDTGLEMVGRSDLSCCVISFGIAIMALTGMQLGPLSLGRMIAALAILIAARQGGEPAGAVSGVVAGCAMWLIGGEYAYLTAAYALGGLLAGAFRTAGKLGVAAAFVVVNGIAAAVSGLGTGQLSPVYEAFAVSVLFMLTPQRALSRLRWNPAGASSAADSGTIKALLLSRLRGEADALAEISGTVRQVSDKLGARRSGEIEEVFSKVADRVCGRCGFAAKCWQLSYNDTMNAFNDSVPVLKREGRITRREMPRQFVEQCCKLEDLMTALNFEYGEYVAREGTQRKVSQVRSVVTDQFEGMAMLLRDLGGELREISAQDQKLAAKVAAWFREQGVENAVVSCYEDSFAHMTVEVMLPAYKVARIDPCDAALELSELADREFAQPSIEEREREGVLIFSEKATYQARFASAQIACQDHKLCGDAYQTWADRRGTAHIILSDGMGSGGNAAVDSAMASGLLSRLIRAGIGHEAALKMVNSALLIKSGEESLATVDVSSVDLYTGKARFYKAGAAPTFLLRSGKAGSVESTSLPAGILRGVAFEESSVGLSEGDIVLMVSDGVIATGVDWVSSELEHFRGDDLQALCEKIANAARLRRIDGHEDDITVVGMRLEKGI